MRRPEDARDDSFLRATLNAAYAARAALLALEQVGEALAPERLGPIGEELDRSCGSALRQARASLDAAPVPEELRRLAQHFGEAFGCVERAVERLIEAARRPGPQGLRLVLDSWHESARAQELLYALRRVLPPLERFWDLPGRDVPEDSGSTAGPRRGVVAVGPGGHHGGFSLYVPEAYEDSRAWPLVVALHGGFGNGRDFLWTWLREARSRGYLLLAPSSVGETWTETEERGLLEILSWTGSRYHLDPRAILLTGLSDGATYTLLYGLAHPQVFRALAPLCGVLHPANTVVGNLERARGVPIYLVHGALDFLFPVDLARQAAETLRRAGADLRYRELPRLSHAYPRSENERILDWFEGLIRPDGPPGGVLSGQRPQDA